MNHCTGFTRSELLRHGIARAGQGLPAIEPGMPAPAGTGLSRRTFLLRGLASGLAVYGATWLGPRAFEAGIAEAAAAPAQPVVVSIFLPGGMDGLTALAPVGDPRYAALRPTLAVAGGSGTTFADDNRLMWHPSLAGLATLHGEGKVAVAPAIGYANADQSHFTSRHYWEVGATDPSARYGWLGRYLDLHGTTSNPLQGLSLDGVLSPTLAARDVPVAAVATPDDYNFWAPGVGDPVYAPFMDAIGTLGRLPTTDAGRVAPRVIASEIATIREQLAPLQSGFTSPVTYPTGDFAHRLASLGAMLAAGMPVRCVSLDAPGGYDTHANQAATLGNDLKSVADAVLAFQRDLEARGAADRVLTVLWSEFGRRPQENGSGTDHGAAGTCFVIGNRVQRQLLGEFPGLATLDDRDNLRSTFDFRALYCAILEQWLGVDAAPVIPDAASFTRPALVA